MTNFELDLVLNAYKFAGDFPRVHFSFGKVVVFSQLVCIVKGAGLGRLLALSLPQKMCDQGAGVEVIDLTISSDEEEGSRSSTVSAILSDSEDSAGFEYVYCVNTPTQIPVESCKYLISTF